MLRVNLVQIVGVAVRIREDGHVAAPRFAGGRVKEIEALVKGVEKVETATAPDFQEQFVQAMAIPHSAGAAHSATQRSCDRTGPLGRVGRDRNLAYATIVSGVGGEERATCFHRGRGDQRIRQAQTMRQAEALDVQRGSVADGLG